MPRQKPNTINEYIAGFPPEIQPLLEKIRSIIKKAVPKAEETISYAIPAFKQKGKTFIYFSGFKHHVGLYPAPRGHEDFKEELKNYKGGKGTVQFPIDQPLPADLIKRIAQFRLKESEEKSALSETPRQKNKT